MGMKTSEVGNWLRQIAGKRDHHEVLSGDYLVLRPGPNFDLLMGNLNHVYFEKRSFSSSGSRRSLTQRRSAMTKGSRFRRASKSVTRRVRSSALAWQW
jgi:hypothetical protein